METRRFAAMSTALFLAGSILLDGFVLALRPQYWFSEHPSSGYFLVAFAVLSVVAAYGAWRARMWGFGLALGGAALVVLATLLNILGGDTIGDNPIVLYTSTMISVRIAVVIFALIGIVSARGTGARG